MGAPAPSVSCVARSADIPKRCHCSSQGTKITRAKEHAKEEEVARAMGTKERATATKEVTIMITVYL